MFRSYPGASVPPKVIRTGESHAEPLAVGSPPAEFNSTPSWELLNSPLGFQRGGYALIGVPLIERPEKGMENVNTQAAWCELHRAHVHVGNDRNFAHAHVGRNHFGGGGGMKITPQNRFQITHATVAIYGDSPGWFVVFDVLGEENSHFIYGWDRAVNLRDTLRAAFSRKEFRVVA